MREMRFFHPIIFVALITCAGTLAENEMGGCGREARQKSVTKKISDFDRELVGKVVTLKNVRLTDARELFEIYTDPQTMEFVPIGDLIRVNGFDAMHTHIGCRITRRLQGLALPLTIFVNSTGEIGGMVTLHYRPSDELLAEVSTTVARRFWGKAVAAEARLLILNHAFDDLGLEKIEFVTQNNHKRNRDLFAKLGINYIRSERLRRPKPLDVDIFGISKESWPGVKKNLQKRREDQMSLQESVSEPSNSVD